MLTSRAALLAAMALGLLAGCHKDNGPAAPAAGVIAWGTTAEPVEAAINADGVPDFVVFCGDPGVRDPKRFCAFDGARFSLLWRTEPLSGLGTDDLLRFGIAGDRLVLVDGLANLHAYDVHTGKPVPGTHRLSARAKQVCSPREHPGKLWIRTDDGAGWLVDPATLQLVALAPPHSCQVVYCWKVSGAAMDEPGCELPLSMPGFVISNGKDDGDDGVAAVARLSPHAHDILAGFSPGSTTPRWIHSIPSDDPLRASLPLDEARVLLAGGRVLATYKDISDAFHLIMLDAKTGKVLWDLTSEEASYTLTATRLYELHWTNIRVRDPATGKVLGEVGAPYEKAYHP